MNDQYSYDYHDRNRRDDSGDDRPWAGANSSGKRADLSVSGRRESQSKSSYQYYAPDGF
jgi:hypothetical protein